MSKTAEDAQWREKKDEIMGQYLRDVEEVEETVGGQGFSSSPGFLGHLRTQVELGAKLDLSAANREIARQARRSENWPRPGTITTMRLKMRRLPGIWRRRSFSHHLNRSLLEAGGVVKSTSGSLTGWKQPSTFEGLSSLRLKRPSRRTWRHTGRSS